VLSVQYEVKMKTGFFETTRYFLSAASGGIALCPAEDKSKAGIHVPEDEIIDIMLIQEKNAAIEIKTCHRTISGIFTKNLDLRDVHSELRKYIKKDVIYVEI